MAIIRPCADLRNNYNEISKLCHETKEPIHITRNGTNDLVILSDELYEIMLKTIKESNEEKIDRLISERFDKHYATFEEFKKDIYNKIEQAFKDIVAGRYIVMDSAVAELEEKYRISE